MVPPFNGLQLLLRAAGRFPPAVFVIADDGMMTPELQAQAQTDKLTKVQFAGSLRPAALREQYQQADIFTVSVPMERITESAS